MNKQGAAPLTHAGLRQRFRSHLARNTGIATVGLLLTPGASHVLHRFHLDRER